MITISAYTAAHSIEAEKEEALAASFAALSPLVEDLFMRERPETVLEIGGLGLRYCRLFAECQRRLGVDGGKIHRLDPAPNGAWDKAALAELDSLGVYDFIFVPMLPEGMGRDEALAFFSVLQRHVAKQALFVTPEYVPGASPPKRAFNPLTFKGFEFSYWMHGLEGGNWQFYSFYKKTDYEPMPMDDAIDREIETDRKLRLAFVMPHQGLNGGLKALLYQMRRLSRRGHAVKAYLRSSYATRVIPSWSELRDEDLSEQVIVPQDASYLDYIKDVDSIVVGWMELLPQFLSASVPVVLWEQGYEYLYGDYREQIDSSYGFRHHMASLYRLPVHILSVSPLISEILKARFNRKTGVFLPYVDTSLYFPWQKNDEYPPVLLVGNPNNAFKGFDIAFEVLRSAWDKGARFTVWWAFQEWPEARETPFEVKNYYMLTQESLALLYRFAYVFLFTSHYEACPLPPMEAMSSGTAVLATDNGGIRTYAVPSVNCLMCEQGDIDGMANNLVALLEDPELRGRLGAEGRKTALEFSSERVTEGIEKTLKSIAFAGL
jgi:glycosyltransferase involved in cell wall biosynthesis